VTLIGCEKNERVIGAVRVVDRPDSEEGIEDDELNDGVVIDAEATEEGGAEEA